MYRHCIYCSGDLGANEAVELFPVGRTLAFDAAKGRLWAVCRKCARWNLAPIEERWEPVEAAERLFRDARLRVQSENVGLAKLPDGTRLICVGAALRREQAAWRYGDELLKRRRRHRVLSTAENVTSFTLSTVAPLVPGGVVLSLANSALGVAWSLYRRNRPVHTLAAHESPDGRPREIRRKHLHAAVLQPGADGGVALRVRSAPARWRDFGAREVQAVLPDRTTRRVLERGLVHLNKAGAGRDDLARALDRIASAGSAEEYIRGNASAQEVLVAKGEKARKMSEERALALEIALHEEQERRAMQGELSILESAWRDAEEIAAIADRLAVDA